MDTSKNIAELFLKAARLYPDNIAIIESEKSISYANLKNDVIQTAAYFKKRGIQTGDRVLVFVPMGVDLYRIVLALFYMGATAVFLDEWVNKKRLELCCSLADCKGFIGIPKARIFGLFSKELRKIPIKLRLKRKVSSTVNISPVTEETSALITFTTGSTGIPKAANRTHFFLKEQFDALIDEIEPKSTDVDLPVLPIVLFVNLGVGCTSIIADFKMSKPHLLNANKIASQIKRNNVNRITSSPFFIKKLAEYALSSKHSFNSIEKIFTGGAPVFPNEAKLYSEAFKMAKIKIVYGSTEAEPISTINAEELVLRQKELNEGLPVGKVYHKIDLKIIRISENTPHQIPLEEWSKLELKDGEIGEIIVAGPHVLKKYYNNSEAFKKNKIIVDNTIWHRTGDSGFIQLGELFLTGRCQQLIPIKSGYLSPFIIENKLQEMNFFGTLLFLKGKSILVLETELDTEVIKAKMEGIPHDEIQIINPIPRDLRHNSKIDYEKLKTLF